MNTNNLIIIASQPRSGSTLLQALLSNNDKVGTVSEPWLLLPFLSYQKRNFNSSKYNSERAVTGVGLFKSKVGQTGFDKDLSEFLLKQYAKVLKNNEIFVLDKTPRYYEILDEIVHYFPNCKIIILKRHPFSVLKSIIQTWNANTVNMLLDYKRDILNAPMILNEFLIKNEDNPNVISLRYEDLVEKPEFHINRLYNWLGIKFSINVLDYKGNDKYKGHMGDPTGVNREPKAHTNSLKNWEKLVGDKYWGNFINGYYKYFGTTFLKDYGQYHQDLNIEPLESQLFNGFLEQSNWDFIEHEVPKWRLVEKSILRRLGISKI